MGRGERRSKLEIGKERREGERGRNVKIEVKGGKKERVKILK